LLEQLQYAYDPAGNLSFRTNNLLIETFTVNNANELAGSVPSGSVTVAGATTALATNVAVNGVNAALYADKTFALGGFALSLNSFTATAKDSSGRQATTSVTVQPPSGVNYSYDLNGNLLSDGNRYFAYDDENELASVWVTNVWRTDFLYDGKMRRRERIEYAWSGSTWVSAATVLYVYDGNVVLQERNASNVPLVTYTRGTDLSGSLQGAGGIGGLLARSDNVAGTQAYYHADGNGNITCMADSSQSVVAQYLYDPYGKILGQSGSLCDSNLYRFSSKEFHANSGLVYYLYRYYDPNFQRWPNRDPIGEDGGINLYGFVNNDPLQVIDADGTWFAGDPTTLETLQQLGLRLGIGSAGGPTLPILAGGAGLLLGAPVVITILTAPPNPVRFPTTGSPGNPIPTSLTRPLPTPLPTSKPAGGAPGGPPGKPGCGDKSQCDFYKAWCEWGNGRPPGDPGKGWKRNAPCDECYSQCQSSGSWPFGKCPIPGNGDPRGKGPAWPPGGKFPGGRLPAWPTPGVY
jgi:RHS repeat-associated protein